MAARLLLVLGLTIPYVAQTQPAVAAGATYYVSTSGSDTAAGTLSAPLRTVQAAVNKAVAGDTVIIRGGTYAERPVLTGKGTAAARITVKSYTGEKANISKGLWVRGDYYRIENILVTPGTTTLPAAENLFPNYWAVYGQYNIGGNYNELVNIEYHDSTPRVAAAIPTLTFMGSYNTVKNINFYNAGAISFVGTGMKRPGLGVYNTVDGGTLHHTYDTLVNISADYATIQNVDMHDPGQVNTNGNATDGIDLDGHHITIRNNKIWGIMRRLEIQHADAIQWWNRADDLLIEGNIIGSYRQYTTDAGKTYYDEGHIQWTSQGTNTVTGATGQTSQRVVIRNNVFINAGEYYVINSSPVQIVDGAANDWKIVNNTFRSPQPIRSDFATKAHRWTIANNIFNGSGGNYGTASGDWKIDYNAYSGTKSPQDGANSLSGVNPQYVKNDVTAATNYGVNADWRLQSVSPVINKGSSTYAPAMDLLGASRVGAPDLGAYEYGGTVPAPAPTPTPTPEPTPTPTPTPTPEPTPTPAPVPAPTGSVAINSGATLTNKVGVTLNSNVTGATQMRFDTGTGYGAWASYAATAALTLPTGDGTKTVNAQYQNTGGTLTVSDTIGLDTAAPTGWFTVNGGATETVLADVTVKNYVTAASKMRFDTGAGFGTWQPFATTSTLKLPAGDGVKSISAQYSDDAGNIHTQATAITLKSNLTMLGTMSINGGAAYTTSGTVGVFSTVAGATLMRCDSGTGFAPWHAYERVHPLTLPAGDGAKNVKVEYMDSVGTTLTLDASIILDTTAPSGTFSINSGATSTKTTNVTAYSNVVGATEMRFDTGTGFGAWSTYAATKALVLPTGNGTKAVRAEYRDAAGNVRALTDTINLFTGKNKLNAGATYTISRYATLSSQVGSAVAMRIDTGGGYGAWVPYSTDKKVVLPFSNGSRTVTAQYSDAAGAQIVLSDTIILDTAAPTGSFRINRGARYAYSRGVYVNSRVSGASLMRIKTGSTYGHWLPYKSTRKVWLTSGKGTKRVYIQYRDAAGNKVTRSDTIIKR